MENVFRQFAALVSLGVETMAAAIIAYGAIEVVIEVIVALVKGHAASGQRRQALVRFGVWLLLGLEFGLAADVVRTAISPTWNDIGQLAAIGLIRTFLNFFLEKDLQRYEPEQKLDRATT